MYYLKPLPIKIICIAITVLLILTLFLSQKKINYNFKINSDQAVNAESRLPIFQEISFDNGQHYNHASSMTMDANQLLVSWVGGSQELAPDIKIYAANLDVTNSAQVIQSAARDFFNKIKVEQDEYRYINSIGNPIIVNYNNQLWLFFASTLGGWATGSINYTISNDHGLTWSKARVLTLSPFFNFSHLLKGPPIFFEDGSLGLPIYSEFMDDGAKLLRLNAKGEVLDLQRLSWNGAALQPVIIPMSPKIAYAFMRQKKNPLQKMLMNYTLDGGQHWDHFASSKLPNLDSAVSAIKISPQNILIAFNTTEKRIDLRFSIFNTDTQSNCTFGFKRSDLTEHLTYAYPYLIKYKDNYFFSYTVGTISKGLHVSLVKFNKFWLETQWKNCTQS